MGDFPVLYVEGRDDQWAIISLMGVNGVALQRDSGPVIVKPTDSVTAMLDGLVTFIKPFQAKRLPVGFVLDIDLDLEKRWDGIRTRLNAAGYDVPADALTPDGAILNLKGGRVGFWLMPDNQSHVGKLEDFLRTLVPVGNVALPVSERYVADIRENVAANDRFRDIDVEKAEISAWLAVQNPPGQPYGTAITSRVLAPTSAVAARFVKWFRELYGL